MTGFALTVTIDGVAHVATPTAGDLVKFERQYDMAAGAIESAGGRVEHVLFIAWAALTRTGTYTGTFEQFVDAADMDQDRQPDPPPVLPRPT